MPDRSDPENQVPPTKGGGWVPLEKEVVYDNPWINVTEYKVLDPSGKPGVYGLVHFKRRTVAVIAIDNNGEIFLIGQTRFPLGRFEFEIPAGGLDEGETLEEAALRELEEETGLIAKRLKPLQVIHPSNGITDEESTVFLAWDLEQGNLARESTEDISMRRVPLAEAFAMVRSGELSDAPSVAGLLRLQVDLGGQSITDFLRSA